MKLHLFIREYELNTSLPTVPITAAPPAYQVLIQNLMVRALWYWVLIHEIVAHARNAALSRQIRWFNNSNYHLVIYRLSPFESSFLLLCD
jgi:hypothetical protein